jgi:hypothetical protein
MIKQGKFSNKSVICSAICFKKHLYLDCNVLHNCFTNCNVELFIK